MSGARHATAAVMSTVVSLAVAVLQVPAATMKGLAVVVTEVVMKTGRHLSAACAVGVRSLSGRCSDRADAPAPSSTPIKVCTGGSSATLLVMIPNHCRDAQSCSCMHLQVTCVLLPDAASCATLVPDTHGRWITLRTTLADCLLQWLEHSHKDYCELCSHRFTFTPIYAPDAPDNLAVSEFLEQLARHAREALPSAARVVYACVCWVLCFPVSVRCAPIRLHVRRWLSQGCMAHLPPSPRLLQFCVPPLLVPQVAVGGPAHAPHGAQQPACGVVLWRYVVRHHVRPLAKPGEWRARLPRVCVRECLTQRGTCCGTERDRGLRQARVRRARPSCQCRRGR